MKRIHASIERALDRHRLVLWYDATGEWADAFESFAEEGVERLRVEGNDFGVKVRVARAPDTRFLVYVPTAKPADAENWLLDLLLQGHEFRADRASLILEDVGLPHEYRHVVEEHAYFFNSGKRVQAVREMLVKDDEARDVRLKMMAVLVGTSAEIDAFLLHFLDRGAAGALIDPVDEAFGAAALVAPFWKEVGRIFGYSATVPTLRDFAVTLFRGANPLDRQPPLQPHAKVFLRRWQDSQKHCENFRLWSRTLENELQIRGTLEKLDTAATLGDSHTFEIFEKFVLHRLCRGFVKGAPGPEPVAVFAERGIEDRLQHLQNGLLEKSVEHGWNPQLADPARSSESRAFAPKTVG